MTTLHSLLADSVVSAAALAGTLAAIAVVRIRPDRDGLSSRFVFALALVSLVLAMRLLAWNVHQGIFETLTRLFAAWIPLGALLVLEGLRRRHAPKLLKQATLIGGVLFSVLAFVSGNLGLPLYGLLVFQLGSFAVLYLLAVVDGNDGLTEQEKRVIARIRFALPVLVVFLASDYGVFEHVVPVRASGVAILFFCWMAISSASGTTGRRDAAFAFVITAMLGAIIGLSATAMAQMDWAFAVQLSAMTLCTGILALVLNETVNAFAVTRRNDIMLALTVADTTSVRAFITSVAATSLLDGSTILDENELAQFDVPTLRAAFAARPVLRPRDTAALPDDARQQFDSLFVTHDATHLLMLAANPLLVMATTLPSVGRNSAVETELALVQRMADLISKHEDTDGTA